MTTLIVTLALGLCGLLICLRLTMLGAVLSSFVSKWRLLGSSQSLTQGKEMLLSVYQRVQSPLTEPMLRYHACRLICFVATR